MGETIGFLLRNLPAVLLVAALVLAVPRRGSASAAERLLAWLLFLPIGITGLWGRGKPRLFSGSSGNPYRVGDKPVPVRGRHG